MVYFMILTNLSLSLLAQDSDMLYPTHQLSSEVHLNYYSLPNHQEYQHFIFYSIKKELQ